MTLLDWIIAGITLVVLVCLSFVMTLADWLVALKKGQSVTLLPERKGGTWPRRTEDKALTERFGEAWTEYKKHTKFLIPFIY